MLKPEQKRKNVRKGHSSLSTGKKQKRPPKKIFDDLDDLSDLSIHKEDEFNQSPSKKLQILRKMSSQILNHN